MIPTHSPTHLELFEHFKSMFTALYDSSLLRAIYKNQFPNSSPTWNVLPYVLSDPCHHRALRPSQFLKNSFSDDCPQLKLFQWLPMALRWKASSSLAWHSRPCPTCFSVFSLHSSSCLSNKLIVFIYLHFCKWYLSCLKCLPQWLSSKAVGILCLVQSLAQIPPSPSSLHLGWIC